MSSSPSKRRLSWSELWLRDQAVRQVVRQIRRSSLSSTPPSEPDDTNPIPHPDPTALLSDQTLTLIFSLLPPFHHVPVSLTCKRWLRLSGRLVKSINLLDWEFLESGRVTTRFPNLISINLIPACIRPVTNSGIRVSNLLISVSLDSSSFNSGKGCFITRDDLLSTGLVDRGVRAVSHGCPNLQKLALVNAGEEGLRSVAEECCALQELELHSCDDVALRGIRWCRNLQILKVVGLVEGFYDCVVSDIGLTVLAQGCRRLVRLELFGCEGSYDGVKAIGQCCQMLEEVTFSNHMMDGGWLAALSFCTNLKTLKLYSCKNVDSSPGLDEHLGACVALEELHVKRCQMRDKMGARALFLVCQAVRELVFEDCWGLDDNVLQIASVCRRVRLLSLEGCSLLTTVGLDALVLSWTELNRLRVVSCNSIKDSEITPALASLFCVLTELKWRPDSRSILEEGLAETGMGMRKGGRPFKKV